MRLLESTITLFHHSDFFWEEVGCVGVCSDTNRSSFSWKKFFFQEYINNRRLEEMRGNFVFEEKLQVKGRVILVDFVLSEKDLLAGLASLETRDEGETVILDHTSLAEKLGCMLVQYLEVNPWDSLVVFPGNGGERTKLSLRVFDNLSNTSVFAKRFWQPGSDPIVTVSEVITERFLLFEYANVIVVDDVISSGQTLQKIWERNAWKFPRARWFGASWLCQMPRGQWVGPGYTQILTPLALAHPYSRRVPINSLSTLLADHEIAQSYGNRHFKKPEILIEILDAISRSFNRQ